MNQYRIVIPPRQVTQVDIASDIADLLRQMTFHGHQKTEIVIGVCDSGAREIKALNQDRFREFLFTECGVPRDAHIYVITHAEIKEGILCQ